jgi:hypothetical protein
MFIDGCYAISSTRRFADRQKSIFQLGRKFRSVKRKEQGLVALREQLQLVFQWLTKWQVDDMTRRQQFFHSQRFIEDIIRIKQSLGMTRELKREQILKQLEALDCKIFYGCN